jgi:hypothetical protein
MKIEYKDFANIFSFGYEKRSENLVLVFGFNFQELFSDQNIRESIQENTPKFLRYLISTY